MILNMGPLDWESTTITTALSTWVLFISLMQLVNHAQFLNTYCLLFLPAAIAASSSPCPTTVIAPFASMHALL